MKEEESKEQENHGNEYQIKPIVVNRRKREP